MSRVLLVSAAAVLVTGTVVTGAGPHSGGGQHDNVARLDIKVERSARVHGTLVMLFLALVLVTLWLIRRDRAPQRVQTRLTVLLVVLVAQAGVGYAQYFSDIPPLLVGHPHRGRGRGVVGDAGVRARLLRANRTGDRRRAAGSTQSPSLLARA